MLFLWVISLLFGAAAATSRLEATSLLTCMDNSQVWASYLNVVFYPHNSLVVLDILAISNINNVRVGAHIDMIAYGIKAVSQDVNLCSFGSDYSQLCPLTSGHLDISFTQEVSSSISDRIPGIAYTIPDLDARVRIVVYDLENNTDLACVEATVSNGKTVQTKYAAWPIAAIAGFGLISSGVVSVIGHSSTAAHIASNSMSLFIYFQSLAITSMLAVAKVPPIAAAWAQNFQWSLGIIKAGFIQDIANWYLQSTGGMPTDVLGNQYLSISVQKAKRGLESLYQTLDAPLSNMRYMMSKRASIAIDSDTFGLSDSLNSTLYTTNEKDSSMANKVLILRGIQRVAYLTGIEITSLYMTGIIFLLFFAFVAIVCMMFFKAIIEILVRSKKMNEGKFAEYRQQWPNIIKGAMYRLLLVAFPQVSVLGFWQFTAHDSVGIVVVAAFLLAVTLGLLLFATIRVISYGRRSVRQHQNPAYLLYGDGKFLNKFGFVYVQYRADCYYFVAVSLLYIFIKTLIVAVLQQRGRIQAVIVFAVELVHCVAVCWIRPFMDKRTNAFNITIAVINTINALFFMFFSYIFNQPQVVASVMAIVFFVLNAAFALFLLIFTIVTCVLAVVYTNPDTRYSPMKDDRVSFLPRMGRNKGTGATGNDQDDIELVALGASAMKGHEHAKSPYDDDSYEDLESSNKRLAYSSAYADAESMSKNSVDFSPEPQQPASTIVGNSNSAYNFNTAYPGKQEEQTRAPYQGYYDRNLTPHNQSNNFL